MLQQSVSELKLTIEELEKRFDSLDDESKSVFEHDFDEQYMKHQ